VITRVFKEQGIMPHRGGQPLHPIHYVLRGAWLMKHAPFLNTLDVS
jgi:hypothetical protein